MPTKGVIGKYEVDYGAFVSFLKNILRSVIQDRKIRLAEEFKHQLPTMEKVNPNPQSRTKEQNIARARRCSNSNYLTEEQQSGRAEAKLFKHDDYHGCRYASCKYANRSGGNQCTTQRACTSAPNGSCNSIGCYSGNHAPATTPAPVPVSAPAAVPAPAPRGGTRPPPITSRTSETRRIRCPICRRIHPLHHCGIFRGMRPLQRQQVAQAHGYCLNCLSHTHTTTECESRGLCQLCYRPHHTLLHRSSSREVNRPPNHRGHVSRLPPADRVIHQRSGTSVRRRQTGPPSRRSTGLSNVVATVQQLQRLLG
ncbi:uncharacterized protein LOC126765530 [Bactrocera neohumeralis]|uniref:uncharacterized protein LOC126765530 n=1 Tax=Bactrocera neohumeralis TaxID=98809 RepID=UPI0021663896|nr:uncharacterized protein LOC126765530 [Bactrocera neohumeralis]